MNVLRWVAGVVVLVAAPLYGGEERVQVSGRYPHLVMFNKQGECGTGAVVEWAGKLWAITYAPHKPEGSDDKLYEIDADLNQVIRKESVGGTPAARMIHKESNQLLIGPYLIDDQRKVRVIPPSKMFGRISAVTRHLTDPANKVYYFDMEGLIYEADVKTLEVKLLYKRAIPGWHGKGAYTAQGHLVIANNGEHEAASVNKFKPFDYQVQFEMGGENAGGLGDWDGKTWKLEERRQFTEVTGPGGIYGTPSPEAPLWSVGWDKRSLLLKVLDGSWQTYRVPKADYSYDGTHGWHTEWPRIREVVPEKDGKAAKLLMNMHGGWFDFPKTFSAKDASGLKPVASYLKITGDFAPWKDSIVFACDDVAASGFSSSGFDPLNSLNGQSQSNLWFSTWDNLAQCGRPAGYGGPWMGDSVKANAPSIPYLFAGYTQRVLHLSHETDADVAFTIEIDADGKGAWKELQKISVPAKGYTFHIFPADTAGQWVRLKTDRDAANVNAYFHYGPGGGTAEDRSKFAALSDVSDAAPWISAVMRAEGEGKCNLAVLANAVDNSGNASPARFVQVDGEMKAAPIEAESKSAKFLQEKVVVKKQQSITSDAASIIVVEDKVRYRLPKSSDAYDKEFATGWPRTVREVVTERSLMNAGGSFYVLPRTNSGGVAHIKPVCTHNKRIVDFCSWRGLMVMSGTRADAKADGHYFSFGGDMPGGLWYGDIDDLWKMGKPKGQGGPWLETNVKANQPSDAYLMTGYEKKSVKLSHNSTLLVKMTLEVDFLATGEWKVYQTIEVPAGQTLTHEFPAGYSAHWIRVRANRDCRATAAFTYE